MCAKLSLFFYWLIILLAITASISLKILMKDERFVIIRLGRFLKIAGPGLVLIIPFIDRGVKVNLSENFPGWQELSKLELDEKTKAFVLNKNI